MQKIQPRLTVALFFTTLVVLAYFGLALVSTPIDFLYRNTANLSTVRDIAQIVALLATLLVFITGLIIAIPTALQPGNLLQKLINVLPIYFLGFLLAGVVAYEINIGAVGNLFTLPQVGPINFIQTWLMLAAILSTLGVVIAAGRARLGDRVLQTAVMTTASAMVLSLVAAVAVIAAAVILSGATASFGGGFPGGNGGAASTQQASNSFGGFGGAASTQEAPASGGNRQGAPQGGFPGGAASTRQAPSGQTQTNAAGAPNATQEAGATGQQGRTRQGQGGNAAGGNGQGAPQGGFPGGGPGGGGFGSSIKPDYEVGAALMAIFAVLGLIGVASAFRVMPRGATGTVMPKINVGREVGMAFVSAIVLTIIFGVIIQAVPTTRDNPTPVEPALQWDSPQTQTLATGACLDCHSNATRWPWYSYVAPMSFLTTMHVHDARAMLNFSELDKLPEFRKSMLASQIAMEIRSNMMPPLDYRLLHPDANLTDTQKQQLIDGWQKTLAATFGTSS